MSTVRPNAERHRRLSEFASRRVEERLARGDRREDMCARGDLSRETFDSMVSGRGTVANRRPYTLGCLDRALFWEEGSALRIWNGEGEPVTADEPNDEPTAKRYPVAGPEGIMLTGDDAVLGPMSPEERRTYLMNMLRDAGELNDQG